MSYRMTTEKDKMLTGDLYDVSDVQLSAERRRARSLCKALNESRDEEHEAALDEARFITGAALAIDGGITVG
jgi:hypothetical protein